MGERGRGKSEEEREREEKDRGGVALPSSAPSEISAGEN